MKVASLFCGAGGADLGALGGFDYLGRRYARLPFEVAFAADIDKWAVRTYNENFDHKAVCADVTELDFATLPDVDVLIAGFPCQSFSMVNQNGRTDGDDRAALYRQVVRFLREKRPKAFVCENVRGLATMKGGAVLDKILGEFAAEGYGVQWRLLNAADYGVPQTRRRIIIVGLRNDLGVRYEYPEPSVSEPVPMKAVVKSREADERWFYSRQTVESYLKHKRERKPGQWNRGSIVDLDKPCCTITANICKANINGSDPAIPVDPENLRYRKLTTLEAAGIQSFPESFKWPNSMTQNNMEIGNAVAPVFFWHVMGKLAEALTGEPAPKA